MSRMHDEQLAQDIARLLELAEADALPPLDETADADLEPAKLSTNASDAAASAAFSSSVCSFCGASFVTRNRLFAHLVEKHQLQERTHAKERWQRQSCRATATQHAPKQRPAGRLAVQPHVVCPSGCWYRAAPMAPPSPKLPSPGSQLVSWHPTDHSLPQVTGASTLGGPLGPCRRVVGRVA